MRKIILASSSPRRKQLLEMVGLKFETIHSDFDEVLNPKLKPEDQPAYLSLEKAKKVALENPDAIIIAADTDVIIENKILGKAKDTKDAKRMLSFLSGKIHTVVTAFTILDSKSKKIITKSISTKITLRNISQKEIDWYIKTEKPFDKAGAYGIQDRAALFVEKIDGDFFVVVGLPIFELFKTLKQFGISIPFSS